MRRRLGGHGARAVRHNPVVVSVLSRQVLPCVSWLLGLVARSLWEGHRLVAVGGGILQEFRGRRGKVCALLHLLLRRRRRQLRVARLSCSRTCLGQRVTGLRVVV